MTARVIDFNQARYKRLCNKPVEQLTIADHIWMLNHLSNTFFKPEVPHGKADEVTFALFETDPA